MSTGTRALRIGAVVDVDVGGSWCMGTVVRIKSTNSIVVALHAPDSNEYGKYQYDAHLTVQKLDKVMPCIDMNGQLKMDTKSLELNPLVNHSDHQSKTEPLHSDSYSLGLSSFIHRTNDMMQLLPLLNQIGLEPVTNFIQNHFNNHCDSVSIRKTYFTALPMDRILPDDIMGHILSFESQSDSRKHCAVSKQWNRLCSRSIENQSKSNGVLVDDESVKVELKRLKRALKESLRGHHKEIKKIEEDIKVISKSFNRRIKELKKFLTTRCPRCNQPEEGDNVDWISCTECGVTLCWDCLKSCEMEFCGTDDIWCPDCHRSRPKCQGCNKRRCPHPLHQKRCDHCGDKRCEDCLQRFESYADDDHFEIDGPHIEHLCEGCYHYAQAEETVKYGP